MEARTRGPIIVVGGGLSGLTAAVELTARGIPVLLLEQKPTLGGRAYSFRDRITGDTVDNGQHALIAAYKRTRALLSKIGTENCLLIQPRAELHLHHPQRGFLVVRFPALPPPLHMIWGGITGSLFRRTDLLPLAKAGWSVFRSTNPERRAHLASMTIREWLSSTGQSQEMCRTFWEPLAVSIMNEHIDRAAASLFVSALRTAFLGGWHNAAFAIPTVGLSDLFAEPARRFITGHGGEVRTGTRAITLVEEEGRVSAVVPANGPQIRCRGVILAVPPAAVDSLMPESLRGESSLQQVGDLPDSPIVSLHLWYDKDFMHHSVLGLVDRRVQWLFRRKGYLSAVISAAHEFVGLTNDALANIAQDDLRSVFGAEMGNLRHFLVIREKRATYSSSPEVEKMRPGMTTPLANLFLAGDWTATGFPATIEGAVVSGEAAAGAVVRCISVGKY